MPKALSHSDEWLFYYIKIATTQVLFSNKPQRGDMIVAQCFIPNFFNRQ